MPGLRTPGPEIQIKPEGINDKLESDMPLCLNTNKTIQNQTYKEKN